MATPPPAGAPAGLDLTPEQVRKLQENRLKGAPATHRHRPLSALTPPSSTATTAKAKLQERERLQRQHAQTGQQPNALGKRPLQVLPADSTSPTAPASRYAPTTLGTGPGVRGASNALQSALTGPAPGPSSARSPVKHFQGADGASGAGDLAPLPSRIGQYVEYDLSTLKNSRGGFLLEGEEDDPKRARERQMQEELKLKRLENARKQGQLRAASESQFFRPLSLCCSRGARWDVSLSGPWLTPLVPAAMALDPSENPKCKHCGSTDLDDQLRSVFGIPCCVRCKKDRPEMYSLLTKTECKEDYLLTERASFSPLTPFSNCLCSR